MTEKAPPPASQAALLEQFLILAKSTIGAAAVELVKQVLEAPNIYVFGELLDMPNIQELATGPHASYYNLLNLYAFGTYTDYLENQDQYPPLTPPMITKLRHLTIVSLATKNKCIPYSTLLKELDLKNLRELEDLIIEVIYADVVRGKLDQKNNRLEVDYTIGRDIKPEDIPFIEKVLQDWLEGCENLVLNIENSMTKANNQKDQELKKKQKIENEVNNIKKSLKTQNQDGDDQMNTDIRDIPQVDKPKKQVKGKVFRGGKFWHKS